MLRRAAGERILAFYREDSIHGIEGIQCVKHIEPTNKRLGIVSGLFGLLIQLEFGLWLYVSMPGFANLGIGIAFGSLITAAVFAIAGLVIGLTVDFALRFLLSREKSRIA